jgi:hypothetical protein
MRACWCSRQWQQQQPTAPGEAAAAWQQHLQLLVTLIQVWAVGQVTKQLQLLRRRRL